MRLRLSGQCKGAHMLGMIMIGNLVGYVCAAIALVLSESWLIALATLMATGTGAVLASALLLAAVSLRRKSGPVRT